MTDQNSKKEITHETIRNHKLYRRGDWLQLNINPPIRFQFFSSNVDAVKCITPEAYVQRLRSFKNFWFKIFDNIYVDEITMYLETSKQGLLHWHGKVQVKDPQMFSHFVGYLSYVKEIRVDIGKITDHSIWDDYITKDNAIMDTNYRRSLIKKKKKLRSKKKI